ncbi:triose-phosphate isomerase [Apilactobacillus timberlakei]|uniref:triose-phosphate isomerase n=1 Tax=Apilactobacillus timberlakei TaxID=2008380 RepID=UPI0015E8685A|nr:triose-phosphate isomerase [Apilactobacillus timberlakei]
MLDNALSNNIIPIICLGIGKSPMGVAKELRSMLGDIDLSNKKIIIAWESLSSSYEKKRMYSKDDVKAIFDEISMILDEYKGLEYKLLLGGNVSSKESKLSKDIGIDGVLIDDRFKNFNQLKSILEPLNE